MAATTTTTSGVGENPELRMLMLRSAMEKIAELASIELHWRQVRYPPLYFLSCEMSLDNFEQRQLERNWEEILRISRAALH